MEVGRGAERQREPLPAWQVQARPGGPRGCRPPGGGDGCPPVQGHDELQDMIAVRAGQDRLDGVRAAGLLGDRPGAPAGVPA